MRHKEESELRFRFEAKMKAAVQSPTPAVLSWVRAPLQERTRKSLSQLLDAAEALINEKGFEDAGIQEIAKLAGSSVGGFYRRFKDKRGLLHALHERFCEEARATADDALDPARWADASLREIVQSFTAFLVEIARARERTLLAFLLNGATDETMRARSEALNDSIAETAGNLLEARSDELGHADPRVAAAFGLRIVMAALTNAAMLRPAIMPLSDDRFTDELSHVFACYLESPSPSG